MLLTFLGAGHEPVLLWKGSDSSLSATGAPFHALQLVPWKRLVPRLIPDRGCPRTPPVSLSSSGTPLERRPPKPCLLPDKAPGPLMRWTVTPLLWSRSCRGTHASALGHSPARGPLPHAC